MKDNREVGMQITRTIIVDEERATRHLGDNLGIYASPKMIADMERLCHDLLEECLDEGESSVGTHVDFKHTAPTPEGEQVELVATLTAIDRRSYSFDVVATDPAGEQAGVCKHSRFVVNLDMTRNRLQDKKAQLADLNK
jgi:fluoroacetyl-CoA thioesterase